MSRTQGVNARPDRSQHYQHTGASDARLYAIPNAVLLSLGVNMKPRSRTMP